MSSIFIANPTLQNRELHVRINAEQTRIVQIPACGQALFPDELQGVQLQKVIKQIENAGAVPANDLKAIRSRFSLLYTVSDEKKAITADRINAGLKRDETVRQDLSGEVLEKSAVAAFNTSSQVGGREVTMEVTEVNDQGTVRDGVDVEITAGTKRNAGPKRRAQTKKR